MKTHKVFVPIFFITLTLSVFISCDDLVEVDYPSTQLITETVFDDDLTATSAVSGLYYRLSGGLTGGGFNSVTFLSELSSDHLEPFGASEDLHAFYTNSLIPTNGYVAELWTSAYTSIYLANSIIEGLEKSTKINQSLKNQLLGEAKFFRGLCHFYLVNLFGDIPYIKTTDYKQNAIVSRTDTAIVFQEITADLISAKSLLASDYSFSNAERVRANKWAATALLARVYLYNKDWLNSENQATEVIENSTLYSLTMDLNQVFLKNSSEAILQFIPIDAQLHTNEGDVFYTSSKVTHNLLNAFEPKDLRLQNWITERITETETWYAPFKYKENVNNGSGAEYSMVLRLAETYLIRAEARAQQENILGAATDINAIRNRAGLEDLTASSKEQILEAIEHERQLELFTEWGHRWFDLIRTEQVNNVLNTLKLNWEYFDKLYPIPTSEILVNRNLLQNFGY